MPTPLTMVQINMLNDNEKRLALRFAEGFNKVPVGTEIAGRKLTANVLENFLDTIDVSTRNKNYRALQLFFHDDKVRQFDIIQEVPGEFTQLLANANPRPAAQQGLGEARNAQDFMFDTAKLTLKFAYDLICAKPIAVSAMQAIKASEEGKKLATEKAQKEAAEKAQKEAAEKAQKEAAEKAQREKKEILDWADNRFHSYDFGKEPDFEKRRAKMQDILKGVDALSGLSLEKKAAFKEQLRQAIDAIAKDAKAQAAAARAQASNLNAAGFAQRAAESMQKAANALQRTAEAAKKAREEANRVQREAEEKARQEKARILEWAKNRFNSYDFGKEPDSEKRRAKMQDILKGVDALYGPSPEEKAVFKEQLQQGINATFVVAEELQPVKPPVTAAQVATTQAKYGGF